MVFFEILADEDEDNETNWNAAKEELGSLIDMTVDEFQVYHHILFVCLTINVQKKILKNPVYKKKINNCFSRCLLIYDIYEL